jgi:hypothetical protein
MAYSRRLAVVASCHGVYSGRAEPRSDQSGHEIFWRKENRGRSSGAAAALMALLLSSGCASTQLNYNTVDIGSTIDSVYTRQTLSNLSKFIDDPNAIPSQVYLTAGTVQTLNTVNPSISFPFAPQIANTTQTKPTPTLSSVSTLAGVGGNISGTNSAQQNYNIGPVSDSNILRNQRVLYRHAVFGTPIKGNYEVPRVFFQDKFFEDPYQLQKPHCVLCAVKQGDFSGLQHPPVYVNEDLPPKWLYWENDPRLNEMLAKGELVDLGHFGNHELYMSSYDYYRGVLTNFVMFTLATSAPVETLTPIVAVTPGTPGGPTPGKGGAAPAAAGPAVIHNLRLPPAGVPQPPAIIQGIQP